jgi:NAD(P)-dependent dehydrogenase (short-subunit alcohol dehydrogenase family)/acyl dehydratase
VSALVPGTRLPERAFGPVTMTDIVRYQGASGDMNPIHHDDEFARAAGYPAAISVGMLSAGWLAAYCTEQLGEQAVRRFRTRFRSQVYRGDRLTASAEVVRVFQAGGEERAELSVRLRKDDGSVVVDGTAEFALTRLPGRRHSRGKAGTMQTGTNERFGLPVALVIGAGGMSMAAARRLGQSHRLLLASLGAEEVTAGEAALRADGIDAVGVQVDVTDPDSVAAVGKFVAGQGRLRTLAHVAGVSPSGGDWRHIFAVNLIGTALAERTCLELADTGTAAVFIASSAGHMAENPGPDATAILDDPLDPDFFGRLDAVIPAGEQTPLQAYRLSKWALMRLCRRRAGAWGAKGARIVSMSPGLINTPQGARELAGPAAEVKRSRMKALALAREGTMVEMADAIEFLASDRASYITGTDVLVDGGIVAGNKRA